MKVTDLRASHFTEPLGMGLSPLSLSWVTEDTKSKKQEAAQIKIWTEEGPVYDSGRQKTISSLGFEPALVLLPRTRYFWNVTVWGDAGDSGSAQSWFETAKEGEAWAAKWITSTFPKDEHFLLTRNFTAGSALESARIYACGLGIYELEVNGKKAGDEYLLPGFHCYDMMLQYQTFDVTALLQDGENTLGASLAPGWYKGSMTFDRQENIYGDTMKFLCELHLRYQDGHEEVLASDGSWRCLPSPVLESNIYDGEIFDAARRIPDWSVPGCQAESFPVQVLEDGAELLTARIDPKIVCKYTFAPKEILHTKRGETVLDFGQNMTGWVEFEAHEPAGTKIKLSYGEILQEECFYRDNLRTAKCEYLYISDGSPAHVRPHFTFYGFRYVKVAAVTDVKAEDFTACHIRSDIDPIGSIETGNTEVNQLFQNAMWGQFDNFLDIPTDCPQRDERLGWTGDAALICGTACKNLYMPAFFHHYLKNVALEEAYHDGAVPVFVPMTKLKNAQDGALWFENAFQGTAIWSDVATLLPWALYENYGDKNLLRAHYPIMKTWVERIRRDDEADGGRGLWLRGMQLGDWLALDTDDQQNPLGATSLPYTATAFYYYSASLTAKAAKALGLTADAEEYSALCRKIKAAILSEYFQPDGSFKIEGTQTACVLSLFLGLYPDGAKERVTAQLKKRLEAKNMHLDTGFCGTPFLCRVLSENGHNEIAYTLLLNDDFPSWLYEVKMGATTVWERWNSVLPDGSISGTGMNSLNHYAYGSIVDWMYRNVCGLNPCEEAPGYKKAVIRPQPDPRIGKAEMKMHTASGLYESAWYYEDGGIRFEITVPFDCEAVLILPDGREYQLTAGNYRF